MHSLLKSPVSSPLSPHLYPSPSPLSTPARAGTQPCRTCHTPNRSKRPLLKAVYPKRLSIMAGKPVYRSTLSSLVVDWVDWRQRIVWARPVIGCVPLLGASYRLGPGSDRDAGCRLCLPSIDHDIGAGSRNWRSRRWDPGYSQCQSVAHPLGVGRDVAQDGRQT
jgi:hypothetical protein